MATRTPCILYLYKCKVLSNYFLHVRAALRPMLGNAILIRDTEYRPTTSTAREDKVPAHVVIPHVSMLIVSARWPHLAGCQKMHLLSSLPVIERRAKTCDVRSNCMYKYGRLVQHPCVLPPRPLTIGWLFRVLVATLPPWTVVK